MRAGLQAQGNDRQGRGEQLFHGRGLLGVGGNESWPIVRVRDSGAGTPSRTGDLPLTRRLLYQLSYAGVSERLLNDLELRPAGCGRLGRLRIGLGGKRRRRGGGRGRRRRLHGEERPLPIL